MRLKLIILLFPVLLNAQTGVLVGMFEVTAGGYTDEFQAVLDEMTTEPVGDTIGWMDEWVDSLVTFNLWDTLDFFFLFAQDDSTDAWINFVDPTGTKAIGRHTPVFTRYTGVTSEGTDTLTSVNLQFDPSVDGVNWTTNSAHWMIVIMDDVHSGTSFDFGVQRTPGYDNGMSAYDGGLLLWACNHAGDGFFWGSESTAAYFLAVCHGADTATLYHNIDETVRGHSGTSGLSTGDFFVLKASGNDEEDDPSSTRTIAAVLGGGKIVDPENQARMVRFAERYLDHLNKGLLP